MALQSATQHVAVLEDANLIGTVWRSVWHALTGPGLSADYWGHRNVSDWQVGSRWEHRRSDGSNIADVIGAVLESTPAR